MIRVDVGFGMLRRFKVPTALAFGLLVSAVEVSWADPLVIQGSTTVANAVMITRQETIEAETGLKYEVIANGSQRGMLAVAEGKAAIGMISANLELEIEKIAKTNPGSLDGKDLRAHSIGETRVAFVSHPSNPVKSLTLDQIAAILKGDVKSWSEVGGGGGTIVIIAEKKGGGIRSLVEGALLSKGDIKAELREAAVAPQVVKIAAQLPTALGLSTARSVTPAVAVIETDKPISQPLLLVTLGEPSKQALKIIQAAKKAFAN